MYIAQLKTVLVTAIMAVCIGFTGTHVADSQSDRMGMNGLKHISGQETSIVANGKVVLDSAAEYIGGKKAMRKQLESSMIRPLMASDSDSDNRILVRFKIGSDGKVLSTTVIRSLSPAIDSAVLGAVRKLTAWKPAIQNGVSVASSVVIPFKIEA